MYIKKSGCLLKYKIIKNDRKNTFQEFGWNFMHVVKSFPDGSLYWCLLVNTAWLTCYISVFLPTKMLQIVPAWNWHHCRNSLSLVISAKCPQLGRSSYLVGLFVFAAAHTDWGVCVGVNITGLHLNAGHDAVCRFWIGWPALLRA